MTPLENLGALEVVRTQEWAGVYRGCQLLPAPEGTALYPEQEAAAKVAGTGSSSPGGAQCLVSQCPLAVPQTSSTKDQRLQSSPKPLLRDTCELCFKVKLILVQNVFGTHA